MSNITVSLDKSDVQILIEAYTKELTELISNHADIFAKADSLRSKIKKLNPVSDPTKRHVFISGNKLHEYNRLINTYIPKGTWGSKIDFVLSENNKAMTTGEISDAIIEKEPALKNDRKRVVVGVSVTLSTNKNKYAKSSNESGDNLYSLINEKSQLQ